MSATTGKPGLTTPGYVHRGLDALFELAAARPLRTAAKSFYFVRHGETDGNHRRIFQYAEQPLNQRGLEQAALAAQALAGTRLDRIVASTMLRAWRTAEIVAEPHKITPEPEDGLRERWFGDLVGTPSHDHDWRDDPPNGETLATFVARVQDGIERALADAGSRSTLLVGHGGILYVLAPSLGLGLNTELLANATPLRFEATGGGWRVSRIADVGASGDNIS